MFPLVGDSPWFHFSSIPMVSWVYVCACALSRFSCVQLFVTLWTVAHQAPLSMGFSRQEYWRGLTCFLPGDLLHPGIQPASLSSLVLAGGFFTLVPPGKPSRVYMLIQLFLKPMNHFIKHSLSGYLKNLEIVMSFSTLWTSDSNGLAAFALGVLGTLRPVCGWARTSLLVDVNPYGGKPRNSQAAFTHHVNESILDHPAASQHASWPRDMGESSKIRWAGLARKAALRIMNQIIILLNL